MASSSSSSSSPPVVPHHRLDVPELCRLLHGEKEQCRVWFRDELLQIPDPLISSLFARINDSLSSSSSSVGSQSRLNVSELCQLLEGEKEQVRAVLRGEMDRLTESLFGRLTNKLRMNTDLDRSQVAGERAQVVDTLDQVESANPLSVQPSQPNPQPTTSSFNHEAHQRHSNGDEVKVNTVEMIKEEEEEEEEDGEMIEIKQEFKEEEEEDETINKVVKMEVKEEEEDYEIESNQVIDHENTEEGTFKYPTLSQPNQHFINTDSSNQQPNEPMHFDPISHQPTTIQSFVQSTSSTNQMQINFASLSTQLESTANAPPVPSVLAQCLPSVSQPNAQVELGSDLDQDLYRRPESMFVAIKVEVETSPTEGDEPNEPANDVKNQSQTTKQAKTRKRKSLITESCSLENSSTSREVSTLGLMTKSKRTRVSSQLDRPETVEEASATVGVDLSEVDEENGGGGLGQIENDVNGNEMGDEEGGHYKIEIVKLKCTEEKCEEEVASRDELHDHLQGYHHTSPYRCLAEGCLERFKQWNELGPHVQFNHSNISIWTCAHCTKTFKKHRFLYQHLHWDHFEGQFKCGYDGCDYDRVATLRSEIRAHQQSVHPKTTIFTCPFHNCGKSFNLKGNLKVHQRIHSAVKPYPCDWPGCGKSFSQQSSLNDHQRIHQGVKPFKCTWNMCGYAATRQSTVIKHIRTQHFHLPATKKQQHQRGIEDNRNPYDYLQQERVNPPM